VNTSNRCRNSQRSGWRGWTIVTSILVWQTYRPTRRAPLKRLLGLEKFGGTQFPQFYSLFQTSVHLQGIHRIRHVKTCTQHPACINPWMEYIPVHLLIHTQTMHRLIHTQTMPCGFDNSPNMQLCKNVCNYGDLGAQLMANFPQWGENTWGTPLWLCLHYIEISL
jgi:hypothetical protein